MPRQPIKFNLLKPVILLVAIGLLCMSSACYFLGAQPWAAPPAYGNIPLFTTVHIESVSVPPAVRVNQPAVFTLELSADASPNFFDFTDVELAYFSSSPAFEAGVTRGTYEPGRFIGLYPSNGALTAGGVSVGPMRRSADLSLTFPQAGRQVLYFGHARNAADGGRGYPVKNPPGYPAESAQIEYLKVVVEVLP